MGLQRKALRQTCKNQRKSGLSAVDCLRSFSAAVCTTAVLMLTFCGIADMLFPGAQPAQTVLAENREESPVKVQLGGDVFGIKMFSDGIIVAALSDVYTQKGTCCPAKEAGIQPGDLILTANGEKVENNTALAAVLSEGNPVELTLQRDETQLETVLTPVRSDDTFRAGMWIRDSAAGIGTVTYYSADGKAFAALGHGVCDSDTKELLPLRAGEPADIMLCGIERGRKGQPGRLRGYFTGLSPMGRLTANTPLGIFGTQSIPHEGELIEVMPRDEVRTGKVFIVSTIDEGGIKYFEAELEKISRSTEQTARTLVVRITDPELLEKTGGIVQGMSGSPIIQDGKLVGAVTHVLVNDPTRGYGIFIENMLTAAS